MANDQESTCGELLSIISVGGGPMTSVYSFSARDAGRELGRLAMALLQGLQLARQRERAGALGAARRRVGSAHGGGDRGELERRPAYRSLCSTWHFRLLHATALLVILPLVAATRLLPSRRHGRQNQSVFVESNDAVLTALGFALTG